MFYQRKFIINIYFKILFVIIQYCRSLEIFCNTQAVSENLVTRYGSMTHGLRYTGLEMTRNKCVEWLSAKLYSGLCIVYRGYVIL